MTFLIAKLTAIIAGGLLLSSAPSEVQACGTAHTDCRVDSGVYRILLPERVRNEAKIPVLVHFHGAGGSAAGVLKMRDMVDTALGRGYAVIAPQGIDPPGRFGRGWSFRPGGRNLRDEHANILSVLEDAEARFNIDRGKVILSGFSIGGSLVWYLACQAADDFAAYAPVGGGFWRPHPVDCSGPVRMLHTHGWTDKTVPLEGRPLGNGTVQQGDIFEGLQLWRQENGCAGLRADRFDVTGVFWRRAWDRCTSGTALELMLFPKGHAVPEGWAGTMLDWFEGLNLPVRTTN
ncbi:MAG: PHB depolymerase family esterase [Stappiaceae bacterium]